MNWPVVEHSLEYAQTIGKDFQIQFILNTNGTVYSDKMAGKLAENGVGIAISLDGDEQAHDRYRRFKSGAGSFKTILSHIWAYLNKGCRVGIEATLGDHNLEALNGLVDIVAGLNMAYKTNVPLSLQNLNFCPEGRLDNYTNETKIDRIMAILSYARACGVTADKGMINFPFLAMLKERDRGVFCRAMGGEMSVEADGDIYPCAALPLKLGNLCDVQSVFISDTYQRLARRVAGNIQACSGCDIEAFCAGGCAADAFAVNQDPDQPTNEERGQRGVKPALDAFKPMNTSKADLTPLQT